MNHPFFIYKVEGLLANILANTSYLGNRKLTNICEYQLLANRGVSTL